MISQARTPGPIDIERSYRMRVRAEEGRGASSRFEHRIKELPLSLRSPIISAFEFAKSIDYHHNDLSSEAYLAHPLRVASMALDYVLDPDLDTVIIALLHNVLEVGTLKVEDLESNFGHQVSSTIQILTVDRSQQWDPTYKAKYYQKIERGYIGGQIVKIIDKLDNLFLIGLNPSPIIKNRYLLEIENYIIPMSKPVLPLLSDYIRRLVLDSRVSKS